MTKTILVVEDEQNILDLLKIIFSSEYNVLTAANGRQALEVVESQLPDLILMDIMMEDMDGMTALKEIKANEKTKDVKILMLSAKCQKSDMDEAEKHGALGFITKPFDPNQLLETIKKVI